MSNTHIITLTIGTTDIRFAPNLIAHNKLMNDAARSADMVGTLKFYLRSIVVKDDADLLAPLLDLPGAAAQIGQAVNEQYVPELSIQVKE